MLVRITTAVIAFNIIFYAFCSFVSWKLLTVDMIANAPDHTRAFAGFAYVWCMLWMIVVASITKK